ncbi:MAG: hypothetical protein M1416_00990, partial [Candidatus Pacearchaeota archaeon]|nr:hypothetical protein [Candidatus Pacearchaeota archaeon]
LKLTKEINLLIVDLKRGKNTVKILTDLNKGFPWPSGPLDTGKHQYLGAINKGIVKNVKKTLEDGEASKLGVMMNLAQDFFDEYLRPASPEELEAPVLHSVLSMKEISSFVYGGKCVGSGGDGTAQFVCKTKEDRAKAKNILIEKGLECFELDLKPDFKKDNIGMVLEQIQKVVPVYAFVAKEGNIDIGTPDLLKKAEEEVLKK